MTDGDAGFQIPKVPETPESARLKMEKRLEGASSWNAFFKEVAVKLALLGLLLLLIWAASAVQ